MGALKLNTKVNINLNLQTLGEWPEDLYEGGMRARALYMEATGDWMGGSHHGYLHLLMLAHVWNQPKVGYQHLPVMLIVHTCVLLLLLVASAARSQANRLTYPRHFSCRSLSPPCFPRQSHLLRRILLLLHANLPHPCRPMAFHITPTTFSTPRRMMTAFSESSRSRTGL